MFELQLFIYLLKNEENPNFLWNCICVSTVMLVLNIQDTLYTPFSILGM